MMIAYVLMGLCSVLPIFAAYQAYQNFQAGAGRMAVFLRDIFFLIGNALLLGLFTGSMLKFAVIDTPIAMWTAISIPILLTAATLLNYLFYFLLECIIPRTRMATYPPFQKMRDILLSIIIGVGIVGCLMAR